GETLGIVGESGSGKTTLALAIMRLIPCEGSVIYMGARAGGDGFRAGRAHDAGTAPPDPGPDPGQDPGQDITRWGKRDLRRLRRDMQIVFQDPFGSLSPRMTAEQIIAEGLSVHTVVPASGRRKAVAEIMDEVGLDPATMERYPHEFSGGQRQRIAIARAMVLRPRVVVLDEPTSALDMTVQVQIVDLLRRLQRSHGLTYLFISHDLRVVRAMSHRMIVMRRGDVVEQGDTAAIFGAPQALYTRELIAAAFGTPVPA
ncbi:MAG: ATP-binding cassette domain-containing protein, partial [Thermoleophilia bacterium]|nr:ATP-binding cassette domain-containing protein [Thermoleophilia bacterium]